MKVVQFHRHFVKYGPGYVRYLTIARRHARQREEGQKIDGATCGLDRIGQYAGDRDQTRHSEISPRPKAPAAITMIAEVEALFL